jgi:hypothetical protein
MNSPNTKEAQQDKAIDQLCRALQDALVRIDRLEQAQEAKRPPTPPNTPHPRSKRPGMFK